MAEIERVGNTFRTSYSTDGSSYTQVGTTTTVTMGATAYVGLAVTSHVDGTLCAAQFDNVSVTTASVCNNNGTCNAGENCSNCAADCGACGQLGLDTRPSNTTCLAPAPLAASYALQDKWSFAFTNPVQVVQPPGDSTRLIVVQRAGSARSVPVGATSSAQTSAFLTLSNVVTTSNGGFLSMAFHPNWATNRYAYVVYTTANRMKRLSRFTSTDGGQTLNASTEQVVLQIQHLVEFNHNGGQVAFGGDGYLLHVDRGQRVQDYARARQAANTNNLFGKVLRIDVNSGSPYAIPLDNPFALGGGAPEVYAYGFRNPWRFSVDRLTGDVWVADVGENTWEEVNVLQSGGFYGWPYYEGDGCFQNSSSQPERLQHPVRPPRDDLWRRQRRPVISGGYVYRGTALPSLYGKYLFGDYVTGQVYIYDPATDLNAPLPNSTGGATVAWGKDNAGELYAVRYDTGRVQQLVIGSGGGAADFPQSLHQTGCFDTVNRTQVTSGRHPLHDRAGLLVGRRGQGALPGAAQRHHHLGGRFRGLGAAGGERRHQELPLQREAVRDALRGAAHRRQGLLGLHVLVERRRAERDPGSGGRPAGRWPPATSGTTRRATSASPATRRPPASRWGPRPGK